MLKRSLSVLLTVLLTGSALARPDSRTMSCNETIRFVRAQGAVVMSTGRHTFDRYVANSGYCLWPNVALREYVPAADGRCPLFVCREPVFETFPFFDDF